MFYIISKNDVNPSPLIHKEIWQITERAIVTAAFRLTRTLKNLRKSENKINNFQKSGIYEIECKDCDANYSHGDPLKPGIKYILYWSIEKVADHVLKNYHLI